MSRYSPTDGRPPIVNVQTIKPLQLGNLRALATIRYDATTIEGVKVIQQPGQRAYVAPPQRTYATHGRPGWAPIVRWEQPLADAISAAVLAAYMRATGTHSPALFDDDGEDAGYAAN
jgi:hypothetical protein